MPSALQENNTFMKSGDKKSRCSVDKCGLDSCGCGLDTAMPFIRRERRLMENNTPLDSRHEIMAIGSRGKRVRECCHNSTQRVCTNQGYKTATTTTTMTSSIMPPNDLDSMVNARCRHQWQQRQQWRSKFLLHHVVLAALLLSSTSVVIAADTNSNSTTTTISPSTENAAVVQDCPPNYNGFSLKPASACSQYVYCTNGSVDSILTCPDGLLYNGKIGEGGICDWAATVVCPPDDVVDDAEGEGEVVIAADDEEEVVNDAAGVLEAISIAASTTTSATSTAAATTTTNVEAKVTTSATIATKETTPAATTSSATSSISNSNIINPDNYYCGTSVEDATNSCIPCPGGTYEECNTSSGSGSMGCFKGIVAKCNIVKENEDTGTSSTTSMTTNSTIAFSTTTATAVGTTTTTGGDAASTVGSEEMTNWMDTQQEQLEELQQQEEETTQLVDENDEFSTQPSDINDNSNIIINEDEESTTTTLQPSLSPTMPPKPTLSPTLPPWTNAPFVPSPSSTNQKTIIGYYASWQWYDRNKFADPSNIDYSKYTRIHYAFFQPDENGNLYGTDEWGDPQILWGPYVTTAGTAEDGTTGTSTRKKRRRMAEGGGGGGGGDNYKCSWDGPNKKNCNYHELHLGLIHLAKTAGVQVMPSIGGWTLSDNFPTIAADDKLRERFAKQCVELIVAYGFDGIDIDWEYPGYKDHSGTPEDTVNFTLLLKAVRTHLDRLGSSTNRHYPLTAALPCGPDKIADIQLDQIGAYLDEFNLMSYDMHGAWDALTGTNAPLFDQGWIDKEPRWSAHGCVDTYVEAGIPLSKLNLGLPFYGRSFQGATGMKQFHDGADDINYHVDEGSPQYYNIVAKLKDMTTYRHEKTRTQYAVFDEEDGGGVVSYDDARAICDKVEYANERGMNGFLIWEISGDMIDLGNGQMSTPLIDAVNDKVQDPNLDCSTLRDPDWSLRDSTYQYAPAEPESVDWSQYEPPVEEVDENDEGESDVGGRRPAPTSNGDDADSPLNSIVMPKNGATAIDEDCPLEYTGYYATKGCISYVYCQNGEVVGAPLPCVPGTLFDVTIGVCTWAANVQCGS